MTNHRFESGDALVVRPHAGRELVAAAPPSIHVAAGNGVAMPDPAKPALLASVLRKRWWLLLPILAISAAAAYWAAEQFGSESSITSASVLHRGLPGAPGPTVYEPLGPQTCSELLLSHNVLGKVLADRNLQIPVSIFSEMLRVEQTRNSSLINVELSWSNPDDAISLLNDLLDEFVNHVATTRRETLRDHIKHVELTSLEAKSDVDRARVRLEQARLQYQQKLIEGGGSPESSYMDLLSNVSKTRDAIDDERAERQAIDQQIKQLKRNREAIIEAAEKLDGETKQKLIDEATRRLNALKETYAEGSSTIREIDKLVAGLTSADADDTESVDAWIVDLVARIEESPARLSRSALESLSVAFGPIIEAQSNAADELQLRLRDVERNAEMLQLRVYPIDSKLAMMQQRLDQLQAETESSGDPTEGLQDSRLGEAETKLTDAESQQQLLAMQLANMRQLEKCRVNEWVVTVPASRATTQVSTNAIKIGALVLALSTLGLVFPVVVAEWFARRDSAEVQFARQTGLPLIAEGLVRRVRSGRGRRRQLDDLGETDIESVRRVALWIQQACRNRERGAAIVFTEADRNAPAPPLMRLVAQCLAEREERVLMVNAVSEASTDGWAADPLAPARDEAPRKGLAEYLAAECSDLEEVVFPSGHLGVDVLLSGASQLPREAMASSSLDRLIDTAADRYSMILVNGPPARRSADLQMLSGRADGIVVVASRGVGKEAAARTAVQELVGLRAPVLGVIS
ncbi:MAG: hypothetical protein AAF266_09690 [Planctomycetota bacterium]